MQIRIMDIVRVGILTVSDRCAAKLNHDNSGEFLKSEITNGFFGAKFKIENIKIVPDELISIQEILVSWTDDERLDLILTTGGTGLSSRDITPEATKTILDREAPGISTALISESMKKTPMAMLSRLVCGMRKNTLIINFPGNEKACGECLSILKPVMQHAVDTIKSNMKAEIFHQKIVEYNCLIKIPIRSTVNSDYIARRDRTSPYDMISVNTAQSKILHTVKPLPSHKLKITDALGYVVTSNIYAEEHFPPFPASMKDGYAVITSDGDGSRLVISTSLAGDETSSVKIKSGECIRITTGAPIPKGADAVVQVEDTTLLSESNNGRIEERINILKAPQRGQDIRNVGSDISCGSLILEAKTFLTPYELGLLATAGISEVSVFRKPKVFVLSTGDELQGHDEEFRYGKIRDSNKIILLALFKENGFSVSDAGIALDEPNEVLHKVGNLLHAADVLVTTGGVSMGEKDLLPKVLLQDLNATLHFGRVNMKPGKPTKYFTININGSKTIYVFTLPGNPVSAAVTCHLFVLPALKALSGIANPLPSIIRAKLGSNVKLDERYEYARGFLTWNDRDNLPTVYVTGAQVSSRMLSMTSANCLIRLPAANENKTSLESGEIVKVQLIKTIF